MGPTITIPTTGSTWPPQLATDREVVTPDRRGWGESTWSPSKDYSRDALIDDMRAVIGAMKWSEKPIIAGHSGAGPTVIAFAVDYADELSKLVIVDSQMNRDEDAVAGPTVGNPPLVFESIEAGMARFAKLNNPPRVAHDRDRMLHALIKVENGFMLKRDPDNGNKKPIGVPAAPPKFPVREMWAELGMVKTPTFLIRGLRSDRFPPETVDPLHQGIPAHSAKDRRFPARHSGSGAGCLCGAHAQVHRGVRAGGHLALATTSFCRGAPIARRRRA